MTTLNLILKRARWYKNRLYAMSMPEIFYRIGESAKRKTNRWIGHRLVASSLRDYGPLPEIPGLRAGLQNKSITDECLSAWARDEKTVRRTPFTFLNQIWPALTPDEMSAGDLWHRDPVSNTVWPRRAYCFAIDYRHPGNQGDIKFVWEANRLQFLQPLAALAFVTQDRELAGYCLATIENWIDHNPPFYGVNWASGIELTLRIISMLTVTTLVGEHLSRTARGKIWASLLTHARWLAEYPSRYSSANNHRAAEGLGLFIIGALCPHFAQSPIWQRQGWDILCDTAEKQILPDGAGAEQTVPYTAFLLEMLLTGLLVAEQTGVTVPVSYRRKIALAGSFLRWLTDAKGNQPRIGDDDNACVFGAYHLGDDYIGSILSCVAALTGRADLSPPTTQPHLRQAIFGAPPPPDFAPRGLRCFPHTGLAVGHHNSTSGEIMLAFDYGHLGYLSIAAHGHADALAVWLHIDGQPIFVDAGTYLYHGREQDRSLFRRTALHNTMTIATEDSSVMAGNFNWSEQAQTMLRDLQSHATHWRIEAEHDGYLKRFGAVHRRSLYVTPTSGAVIEDQLVASAAQPVEISFLLHPDLTARLEGRDILIFRREKQLLRLRHDSNLVPHIGAPQSDKGGWYSPAFNIKQATTRIVFAGILAPDEKATTHMVWAN